MIPSTPTIFPFATTLPLTLLSRPADQPNSDWQEFDFGPGSFSLSNENVYRLRIKNIDDDILRTLIDELSTCKPIVFIDLSENRKITNKGLSYLKNVNWLTQLSLSSCSITDSGMVHLTGFRHLTWLNLSYCNRITDAGLKSLQRLSNLAYLDVQGCSKLTHNGLSYIHRRGLTIFYGKGTLAG